MRNTPPRRLESLELAVTSACNLRCRHCSAARGRIAEPTLPELRKTIAAAAPLGATSLDLTGGEPTLRDDLEEIVRFAKDRGFTRVKTHTNGTLLTPDRLTDFRDAGLDALAVSIDGSTAELHARTRRTTPDEFRQTLETIRTATDLGIAVKVNTAISMENLADAPRITALAADLGCYEHRCCLVAPVGRGAGWRNCLVDDAAWERTLAAWPTFPIAVCVEIRRIPAPRVRTTAIGCLLTTPRQLHVGADGSVFPCARMAFAGIAIGSTRTAPLVRMWEDAPHWRRVMAHVPRCCPHVGRITDEYATVCPCRKITLEHLRPRSYPRVSAGVHPATQSSNPFRGILAKRLRNRLLHDRLREIVAQELLDHIGDRQLPRIDRELQAVTPLDCAPELEMLLSQAVVLPRSTAALPAEKF